MSTPAQIRAVWQTNIWDDVDIRNLTPNIYSYEVTQESQSELSKLRDGQEINYITWVTTRLGDVEASELKNILFRYTIDVRYNLQSNKDGSNFNEVIDNLITIESKVITALGQQWSNTVDLYNLIASEAPLETFIDGRTVWQGQNVYEATKLTPYV